MKVSQSYFCWFYQSFFYIHRNILIFLYSNIFKLHCISCITNCLWMPWFLKPSILIFAISFLESCPNKGSFFMTVFKSRAITLLNDFLMFITHSLFKKNNVLFQLHDRLSLDIVNLVNIANSYLFRYYASRATAWNDDIYQICSKLTFKWSFNFEGVRDHLLLVYWVKGFGKWSGSES